LKKKIGLILGILVGIVVLVGAFVLWGGPTSSAPTVSGSTSDYMPSSDTMIIEVDELRRAMTAEGDDLVVIGTINPALANVPFTTPFRSISDSYLVWRPDYSGSDAESAISSNITGMRRSVSEMEELLSRTDITSDTYIVIYSADAMHDAARIVWQLRMMGHENVWYLNGGLNAWLDGNHPSTAFGTRLNDQDVIGNYSAVSYMPETSAATLEMVVYALENPEEWVVIDTRSGGEFDGEQTDSSSGAFGTGRIAGSVHVNWSSTIDPDTQLIRSVEELEELYSFIDGRNVIVYCQSGVRSGHTWLVLTDVLGMDNVYNYDGSWIEWSYAASDYSDFDGSRILELIEEWTDHNGPI